MLLDFAKYASRDAKEDGWLNLPKNMQAAVLASTLEPLSNLKKGGKRKMDVIFSMSLL
jgi:hypothetical protein